MEQRVNDICHASFASVRTCINKKIHKLKRQRILQAFAILLTLPLFCIMTSYVFWNNRIRLYASSIKVEKELVNIKLCYLNGWKDLRGNNSRYVSLYTDQGRLGNHLFQYASLIGVAKLNGYVPILPENFSLFQYYKLRADDDCTVQLKNVKLYTESAANKYEHNLSQLSKSKNWTLTGYFQSWKYFDDITDFRETLELKDEYRQRFLLFWEPIQKKGVQNICIHVRRGDFTWKRFAKLGYTTAPESYIIRSMTYFYDKYPTVQFIMLSDDMAWCKRHYLGRGDIHFSPFKDSMLDMEVMKSCDHVIITSGSFGWWGGWLSGGTVIYYKGFPRPGSWLETQFNKQDYFPKHWIGMY